MTIRKFCLLFIIIFSTNISVARAMCIPTNNGLTIGSITANFAYQMFLFETWMELDFLPNTIYPVLKTMAEQWTVGDMKSMEEYSTMITQHQTELAKLEIQRLKNETVANLQPSEEICNRITQGSRFLSSSFRSEATKRELLQSSLGNQLSMPGSPSQYSSASHSLSLYDYHINNTCTSDDMGGALQGICTAPLSPTSHADIDPVSHFSNLTVGGRSDELQVYIDYVCGGLDVSLLPDDYYEDSSRKRQLLDVYGYWQYAAFCKDSIVSYASLTTPGAAPLMPEQREALTNTGMDPTEIDYRYEGKIAAGPRFNPSLHAQMDMMMVPHKNPKSIAVDQMTHESALLSHEAMTLATEFMLMDQYKDIWAQETRNLSLYLGLRLKEQRAKANAALLAVSKNGKKS